MAQQIMLRSGDAYYKHLRKIQDSQRTKQREHGAVSRRRSSLQGAWFMQHEQVQYLLVRPRTSLRLTNPWLPR